MDNLTLIEPYDTLISLFFTLLIVSWCVIATYINLTRKYRGY